MNRPRSGRSSGIGIARGIAACVALIVLGSFSAPARAQNPIVTENQLAGNPASEWDVSGAGDLTIQGFATDISVNRGETVHFKIRTDAASYHIDVYRLGWYQGLGARKVGTGVITAGLPQTQPADLYDPTTGLTDCGNWDESAHWDVPPDAVSGIYLARLTRDDTQGASHVIFIVRDDASHSDLLFQTSDGTWQAYNNYGGNSLYSGSAPFTSGHAAKVSYNRPFLTRNGGGGGGAAEDWVFNAEYPMLRWLEQNGYDVSYTSEVDSDRRGGLILNHKAFLSVGHDEYWSAGQRANVQAARDAGVHLAFFSGNEIYWKTRYEPSSDPSATPYRTLVCYKEGTLGENVSGSKTDPLPNVWTGLWRDGCPPTYAPNDACLPENALSGQISWDGTTGAIQVPDTYKDLRFWRNTAVAGLGTGQTATLAGGTLGYEWDWQQYDASYPPGRIQMSSTTLDGRVHHLSLYRAASGALVFGAGTVQWSWGLDGTHDRGGSTPDLSMKQATVNLLADMNAQPATLEPVLVSATMTADLLAPTSAIASPADGASVPGGTPLVIQGTASDAGGGVVAGVEVSVDGGATWHVASGTTSWSYAWTPGAAGAVTLRSRGFDDSGNLEAPGSGISVTVTAPPPPTCPCTIFQVSDAPAVPLANDNQPLVAGTKFTASEDGFVTALRFYKGTGNGGTHIGQLWTATGTPLAQATFAGETSSGWQQVSLTQPVAVTSGTAYVVSYFSSGGGYAYTNSYFTQAHVNGPLRALANGENGPNGVYDYSAVPTFPTSTFQASNYWADVVFNTTVGPDVTPPSVVAISPTFGATGVTVTAVVAATFDEALDPLTVDGTTFQLTGPGEIPVAGTVTYDAGNRRATFTPSAPLAYATTYMARLSGGANEPRIKDLAGNALAADDTWSFSTAAQVSALPPDQGPGGPIVVLRSAANPFSTYYAEILRAEGLNEFAVADVAAITPGELASFDVAILGETPLSPGEVTMLGDWVNAGGTLIAMRPDPQLDGLLGISAAGGSLANAYLQINTASAPGAGIASETMQFHGTADQYLLAGATSLGALCVNSATPTAYPAATLRQVGGSGGRAVAFAYDLARSVVYTRQGNPAWAGQERDGTAPIRSNDLFFGAYPTDPQPDWVDLTKVAIPQADEQQRWLANIILSSNLHRKPLPRFWYFPKGKKAAVIMTGDDHGDTGMQPRFDLYQAESPPGCSAPDWECVRATGYEYVGTAFTDALAQQYTNLGFEVALHVNTNCADWTPGTLESFYSSQLSQFTAAFPSIPSPSTNRTHCIAWSDWSTQAETELAHGIRLDTNYYYWPQSWIQDRPGMFTGSGMPMRFARMDGSMIDCYQAVTQMTDESGQSYPMTIDALLDKALDSHGYYGAFCANMHFDNTNHPGSNAIVASALARGIPVVSAKQMLDWVDGRNAASFGGLTWSSNTLSFTIAAGSTARNLEAMLPVNAANGQLSGLTRDSQPVTMTADVIKGVSYDFFPAVSGNYVATYTVDTTPPVISSIVATPALDGTSALVTWTTDEASDSRVDYGTNPTSLTLNASSAPLVTSHSVSLTGLARGTTYAFRVTSADAASNAATSPVPPATLSFTTPAVECPIDQSPADFAAGTPDPSLFISQIGSGSVILAPTATAEFVGTTLPPDWQATPWAGGGTAAVSGGLLHLDGARAGTIAAFTPGRSMEFVATFRADAFQHVGWVADMAFDSPWIIFSTGSAGDQVYARANDGSQVALGAALLGAPHRYRIDWNASSFVFFVDGSQVATINLAVGGSLLALASDLNPNGTGLDLQWLRVTPYASGGTLLSRVFDTGGPTNWGAATWTASVPTGTSLVISARIGDTATPDGSWTPFAALANGATVGGNSRYLQYRADLATTDPKLTPALAQVAIACAPGPDVTPPVISGVAATPTPDGQSATVVWVTNELSDSRVDYGVTPTALPLNVFQAPRTLSHSVQLTGLTPGTTYSYRVTSADAAANSATDPNPPAPPASFTAPVPVCTTDQTAADFGAGTPTNTYVSVTGDGEVILAPASGAEFLGATLPPDWQATPWGGGGGATVSGGQLHLDGARAGTIAPFGSGRSMEFVATFRADAFQHVGWVADMAFDSPWIIFSTGSSGNQLYARASDGTQVPLGAALLGAPHRYRIDWGASSFTFWVDGSVVTTVNLAVGANLLALASDANVNATALDVDWLRVTPYASAGTFASRVIDGGASTRWANLSWDASVPTATAVALEARGGNTPVPDGTWTAYQSVASSGAALGFCARYVQYQASLSSSDPGLTPELRSVSLACSPATGAPPAVADLAAAPGTGNDTSGGLKIRLTWTAAPGTTAQVFRHSFGDYPLFRAGHGGEPAIPATPAAALAAGWTLTAVTASGQSDPPASRDYEYYVVFQTDACGSTSPPSNRAGIPNYLLGDVSDGVTQCQGDNVVNGLDVSFLGAHYGATLSGPTDPLACLDVGPTSDFSTRGRPQPDGVLEFEDLVMIALNYTGAPGPAAAHPAAAPAAATANALRVDVPPLPAIGGTFVVTLGAAGAGNIHALSVDLGFDPAVVEQVGVESGELLARQITPAAVLSSRAGKVDFALLGPGGGLSGDGALFGVRFRVKAIGDPAFVVRSARARDGANHPVTLGPIVNPPAEAPPARTQLGLIYPNPFARDVSVRFDLHEAGPVRLRVFDIAGRRVRTLADGPQPAGRFTIRWEGMNDSGTALAPGLYFVRLETAGVVQSRPVWLVR